MDTMSKTNPLDRFGLNLYIELNSITYILFDQPPSSFFLSGAQWVRNEMSMERATRAKPAIHNRGDLSSPQVIRTRPARTNKLEVMYIFSFISCKQVNQDRRNGDDY